MKQLNFTESVDKKIRGICSESIYFVPFFEHIIPSLHKTAPDNTHLFYYTSSCLVPHPIWRRKKDVFLSSTFYNMNNNTPPLVFGRLKGGGPWVNGNASTRCCCLFPSEIMQMGGSCRGQICRKILFQYLLRLYQRHYFRKWYPYQCWSVPALSSVWSTLLCICQWMLL